MSGPDSTSRKCGHPKRDGSTCARPAGDRTDHHGWGRCWLHAGNSPNGIKFAARMMVDGIAAERRQQMTFYGVDLPELGFAATLAEEVHRSRAIVVWLQLLIEQWRTDEDQVVSGGDGDPEVLARAPGTGLPKLGTVVYFDKGGTVAPTEVAAWLSRYMEERQHLARVTKMALDAGVSERLVSAVEQSADAMVTAIRGFADEAGIELTPERLAILGRHLRAVDGEPEAV